MRPTRFSFFRLLTVLALLLLAATPAHAENCEGYYFDPSSITPDLLPPPPVAGSPDLHGQILAVVAAQRHSSAADLNALGDEQDFRLDLMTAMLGPHFDRTALPLTFALLDRALADGACVNDAAKKFWNIKRPYLLDRKIRLLVRPVANGAYPGEHANGARLAAEILGMLLPGRREVLRARADAIARHRVMAGVQYPDALEGGRLEAMQILGALVSDDGFQRDLAAAQHELGEGHWR